MTEGGGGLGGALLAPWLGPSRELDAEEGWDDLLGELEEFGDDENETAWVVAGLLEGATL